jgi:hypothetical protein
VTPAQKQEYANRLEKEIEDLDQRRIELLRDIVACLSKVIDAIPDWD